MANNLDLAPDSQLAFALAALRGMEFAGPVDSGQQLVPGIFFGLDPEANNTVQIDSRPGDLMTMRFQVDRPGRWLTLNLGIGGADLSACKIIGFVCKSDAPMTATCRVSVRSGVEGGHRDAFFVKTMVSYPTTSLHLDVLELEGHPDIPTRAPWREVVMFFEVATSEIALRDFRLIVI